MSSTFSITAYDLAINLPPGWDGAIYRREPTAQETTSPVVHAATFPLPARRGDFGSGAVELMGPRDVFVALVEYQPESARTALFALQGIPAPLRVTDFSPTALQRTIPGQAGVQRFFSQYGRAFCLYVVLGSFANRDALVPLASTVIQGLVIAAAGRRA
jgi:hypothetical protein